MRAPVSACILLIVAPLGPMTCPTLDESQRICTDVGLTIASTARRAASRTAGEAPEIVTSHGVCCESTSMRAPVSACSRLMVVPAGPISCAMVAGSHSTRADGGFTRASTAFMAAVTSASDLAVIVIVARSASRGVATLIRAPVSACRRWMVVPCGPIIRPTVAASQVVDAEAEAMFRKQSPRVSLGGLVAGESAWSEETGCGRRTRDCPRRLG